MVTAMATPLAERQMHPWRKGKTEEGFDRKAEKRLRAERLPQEVCSQFVFAQLSAQNKFSPARLRKSVIEPLLISRKIAVTNGRDFFCRSSQLAT
jgi:hypothetical protein